MHVVTDSPIEGGLAYTVAYWKDGRLPDSFPGNCILVTVPPEKLRRRFVVGAEAEYWKMKDNEGWISCKVIIAVLLAE